MLKKNIEKIQLILLTLIFAITPLIVRVKVVLIPEEIRKYYLNQTQISDTFTYYKVVFFLIGTLLLIGVMLYAKPKIKWTFVESLSVVYVVAVIVSTLMSIAISTSFFGFVNRFEGFVVLSAYIGLMIATTYLIQSISQVEWLVRAWMISFVILSIIGLSQYLKHDFIMSDFGKHLIMPVSMWGMLDQFKLSLPEGIMYQTLFHYNYVGFYTSLIAPFFMVLAWFEKRMITKCTYIGVVVISLFNLYASTARNGIIGVAIALVAVGGIVLLSKSKSQKSFLKYGMGIAAVAVAVVIFAGVLTSQNDRGSIFKNTVTKENFPLNEILTDHGDVFIDHDGYKIIIRFAMVNGQLNVNIYDMDNNELTYSQTATGEYVVADASGSSLPGFSFKFSYLGDNPVLETTIDQSPWHFIYSPKTEEINYLSGGGVVEKLQRISSVGFEGNEKMGSARGYIWSRALALVPKYFLFGSGPDTFALIFPQNDYIGKFHAYGTTNVYVDKAHSIYLDYLLNTGVIAFLAMLLLYGGYLLKTASVLVASKWDTKESIYKLAIFGAVIGYLVSGLFNDTNISVTPIFFILLGIGYRLLSLQQQKK